MLQDLKISDLAAKLKAADNPLKVFAGECCNCFRNVAHISLLVIHDQEEQQLDQSAWSPNHKGHHEFCSRMQALDQADHAWQNKTAWTNSTLYSLNTISGAEPQDPPKYSLATTSLYYAARVSKNVVACHNLLEAPSSSVAFPHFTDWEAEAASHGTVSFITVPLRRGDDDTIIAVISLSSMRTGAFQDTQAVLSLSMALPPRLLSSLQKNKTSPKEEMHDFMISVLPKGLVKDDDAQITQKRKPESQMDATQERNEQAVVWAESLLCIASICIVYASFADAVRSNAVPATVLSLSVAGMDILLLLLRWAVINGKYHRVFFAFLRLYRAIILPIADAWMASRLVFKYEYRASTALCTVLIATIAGCYVLGIRGRQQFLHAPLQFAVLMLASVSKRDACEKIGLVAATWQCTSAISCGHVAVGVVMPGILSMAQVLNESTAKYTDMSYNS